MSHCPREEYSSLLSRGKALADSMLEVRWERRLEVSAALVALGVGPSPHSLAPVSVKLL